MLSEEQLRDVLAVKERIAARMEKCQEELNALEREAAVLDEILRQSSFARASSLPPKPAERGAGRAEPAQAAGREPDAGPAGAEPAQEGGPEPEIVKLVWKQRQSEIGSAAVRPGSISITLDGHVSLDADTPPLKSFFVGKVIGGMRKKDLDDGLEPIDCSVLADGRQLRGITVTGYRDASRVREIINTAEWSLNRMLERAAE